MIDLEKTILSLNAHLDDNPTDWDSRLVLADLLDDLALPKEARYQRWAVAHKKCPDDSLDCWYWFSNCTGDIKPPYVGPKLHSRLCRLFGDWQFPDRQTAENRLQNALETFDYTIEVPVTTNH